MTMTATTTTMRKKSNTVVSTSFPSSFASKSSIDESTNNSLFTHSQVRKRVSASSGVVIPITTTPATAIDLSTEDQHHCHKTLITTNTTISPHDFDVERTVPMQLVVPPPYPNIVTHYLSSTRNEQEGNSRRRIRRRFGGGRHKTGTATTVSFWVTCVWLLTKNLWTILLRQASRHLQTARTTAVKTLEKYVAFISDSWNQDKLLKFMQYSSWMLSRYHKAQSLRVLPLPPLVLQQSWEPHHQHHHHVTSQEALAYLSTEVGWARYVTRLLGFPMALKYVLTLHHDVKEEEEDGVASIDLEECATAWGLLFYYAFEGVSYMKWKTPEWTAPSFGDEYRIAEQACSMSCRGWFLYLFVDLIRSIRTVRQSYAAKTTTTNDDDDTHHYSATWEKFQILRNILLLGPALHWSMPHWDIQPWMQEDMYQSLMWLESVVCLTQAIVTGY